MSAKKSGNYINDWISLDFLLQHGRDILGTPNDLFQTVLHHEHGIFQFAKPKYVQARSRRETQGKGKNKTQTFYQAKIFIRTYRGKTFSENMSLVETMTQITPSNAPSDAIHGTSIKSIVEILAYGISPDLDLGGATCDSEDSLAHASSSASPAVHFAATLPNDASHVISGYRASSEVCIFFDLDRWIDNEDRAAWYSPNKVICVFDVIPPSFILAAIRVSDNWDYVTRDWAQEPYASKLKLQELGSAHRRELCLGSRTTS